MSFLKAEWRKLALANYEVDPKVLTDLVPFGTELDFWNGKCYVSLVGFRFVNTRVLGIKVPGHVHFEEVNLRFYVKRKDSELWKRGVVFVKEIVPKPAITFIANTVYRENYETMKMSHSWEDNDDHKQVSYRWRRYKNWHSIQVKAKLIAEEMLKGSKAEFITEHYWGYAKVNDKKTHEYEVTHPRWKCYDVLEHNIQIDFGEVYGERFAFLNNSKPASVMLAEGSSITVERNRIIACSL